MHTYSTWMTMTTLEKILQNIKGWVPLWNLKPYEPKKYWDKYTANTQLSASGLSSLWLNSNAVLTLKLHIIILNILLLYKTFSHMKIKSKLTVTTANYLAPKYTVIVFDFSQKKQHICIHTMYVICTEIQKLV